VGTTSRANFPLDLSEGLLLGPPPADEGIQGRQAQGHVGRDGVVLEVPVVRREEIELEVLAGLVLHMLAIDPAGS
jgi:hypothetical protein